MRKFKIKKVYIESLFLRATKYLRHISLQFAILITDKRCEMKIQTQRTLTITEYEFLSDIKFSAGTNLDLFNL